MGHEHHGFLFSIFTAEDRNTYMDCRNNATKGRTKRRRRKMRQRSRSRRGRKVKVCKE